MPKTGQERRQYFRIIDEMGVSYHEIEEESENDSQEGSLISNAEKLEEINSGIDAALSTLKQSQPQASELIDLVNQKLEMVINMMQLDSHAPHVRQMGEASISACGIAFPIDESFNAQTLLALTLFLDGLENPLHIKGKVVDCQASDEGQHLLRVEFVQVEEATREILIQYIVQRQSLQLKRLRESDD